MTTVEEYAVPCGICRHTLVIMGIMSTNQMGPPDLDLRPPPMERDLLGFRMHRCESCGYSGPKIYEAVPSDAEVVKSERYQNQLATDAPELANTCACAALLSESAGKIDDAAWHWLEAAWVCDDESQSAKATEFRIEAARCMEQAVAEASNDQDLQINGSLVLIDLNRRVARFDRARHWCQAVQTAMDNATVRRIVLLQLRLIEEQNVEAHQIPTEGPEGGA